MPKQPQLPPEPQPQYEGYEWLAGRWGRSGNPVPARIGAIAMGLAALIVIGWTIRGILQDAGWLFVLVSFAVAAICLVGTSFYLVEAHFAARAAREQQSFTPADDD
ncbi:MAG: hypothetical protein NVV57_00875 [Demequina sp.]|jgi:hypothetical protein|nr:hypothetical protein [Demequina sp.]